MPFAYSVQKVANVANVSTDRILNLKPSGDTKNSSGLIDKGLFSGSTVLHAKQDMGLWSLHYRNADNTGGKGALPGALQQKFTNFNQLMKFVTSYFKSRNIDVVEVID